MIKVAVLILCFVGASLANPAEIGWRVVGGSNAPAGAYPFIISLRTSSDSHTCGGSLIHNSWVQTAAHCVVNGSPSSYSVVAGTNSLNSGGTRVGVSRIIVHSGYDSNSLVNDIALLQVSSPLQETSLIKIIRLETVDDNTVREVTLIGWGRTSYPGNIATNLQHLPLRTTTLATCRSAWPAETIANTQICTFTQQGQGACHGDSGGPLIAQVNGEPRLVGGVSWGAPCAVGAPDVFTRISGFVPWINAQTGLNLS